MTSILPGSISYEKRPYNKASLPKTSKLLKTYCAKTVSTKPRRIAFLTILITLLSGCGLVAEIDSSQKVSPNAPIREGAPVREGADIHSPPNSQGLRQPLSGSDNVMDGATSLVSAGGVRAWLDKIVESKFNKLGEPATKIGVILKLYQADGVLFGITEKPELLAFEGVKPIARIPIVGFQPKSVVSFDPAYGLLAEYRQGKAQIIQLPEMERVAQLTRLKTRVNELALQSGSQALVIAGADSRVYRWRFGDAGNLERGKDLERFVAHSATVSTVAVHPYGRFFVSGDWQGRVIAWLGYDQDFFGGEYDRDLFGTRSLTDNPDRIVRSVSGNKRIAAIEFTDDGKYFWVITADGVVEYWAVRGFERLASAEVVRGPVEQFSTYGKNLVTYGRDSVLKKWKAIKELDKDEVLTVWKVKKVGEEKIRGIDSVLLRSEDKLVYTSGAGGLKELTMESKIDSDDESAEAE